MARLRQLKMLLWKNFLIKKRTPLILVLETLIPFALFVLLGVVRYYEPVQPTQTVTFQAEPLPSAGILSVIQSLMCHAIDRDGDGLPYLTENSTFFKYLSKIDKFYRRGQSLVEAVKSAENFDEIAEILSAVSPVADYLPAADSCINVGQSNKTNELGYGGLELLYSTLCGNNINTETNSSTIGNQPYLKRGFKVFVMFWEKFLTGQLKVLYSPGSSPAVESIVKKANTTFEWIEHLTIKADKWLTNTSVELRQFIENHPKFNSSELSGKIAAVDNLACWWLDLTSQANFSIFIPFDEEYKAVNYAINDAPSDNLTVFAVIVFDVNDTAKNVEPHTSYKIRMNATYLPSVRSLRELYWSPIPRNWDYYYYSSGFMFIQDVIDRAIIDSAVGFKVVEPGVYSRLPPAPCYLYDIFLFTNSMILPLCMTISYVYAAAIFVQNIVSEKEHRLKEFMKVMGLSNTAHGLAWFITAFIQLTFSVTGVTFLLKFSNVLAHSDPFIIWMILEIYAIATITFCFLVSSFFTKSKIASATAGMLYFLSYVPSLCIGLQEDIGGIAIPQPLKVLACFLSTSAFGICCKYIGLRESEGLGVHWANIASSPLEHDDFSVLHAVLFLLVDACIYAVLAWYIEIVNPGAYGIPKPWYFPFTKTYWAGSHAEGYYMAPKCFKSIENAFKHCFLYKTFASSSSDEETTSDNELSTHVGGRSRFEQESDELGLAVDIDNLTKFYQQSKKTAVDKLSLKLYESQVTGLLGHNGAGKSTTMSILTGIIPPSSGTVRVFGRDIRSNLDAIRSSMGFCPQHNILFEHLTPEEHLIFYGGLKRTPEAVSKKAIDQLLDDVGLMQKKTAKVGHLSGGMKRKLSIALAFLGGSRLVVLDEPTAGVDPFSRRAIWDLIVKYKQGRAILLSTHHMEEADALSDRIAVIAGGSLECCGSSLFIRNNLCEGYHLNLVKGKDLDVENVVGFMKQEMPLSTFRSETKDELHFILPYSEERQDKLAIFFKRLDNCLPHLNIATYGLFDSTLEEAFLAISKTHSPDIDLNVNQTIHSYQHQSYDAVESNCEVTVTPTSTAELFSPSLEVNRKRWSTSIFENIRHFVALLAKRFIYIRRSWKVLVSQLVLPALFIAIAMTMSFSTAMGSDPEPFELSPSQYNMITQPGGIYTPTANYASRPDAKPTFVTGADGWVDAGATNISNTIRLITDLSATCVLTTAEVPSTFMTELQTNFTNKEMLKYFNENCAKYFAKDVPLSEFLPQYDLNEAPLMHEHDRLYYPICHCNKDNSGFDCPGDFEHAPEFTLITGDHVVDLGSQNITLYLLYTSDDYRQHRYGALQFGSELEHVPEDFGDGSTSELRRLTVRRVGVAYFDNRAYHAQPIYLNVFNNAILRANVAKRPNELGNPAAYGITVYNHPLNATDKVSEVDSFVAGTDMLIAVFIIIGMSFVPSSFVVFLVYERSLLVKHIQFMTGLHPVTYWFSNYVWDLLNYLFPATCCIVILLAFNVPSYTSSDNLTVIIGLFCFYGWSVTPMMYPTSFLFNEPSKAYVVLVVLNLFIGTTCLIATCLLDLFKDTPVLNTANDVLKIAFLPFPSYCLGRGIMEVAVNHYNNEFLVLSGQQHLVVSPLSWEIAFEKFVVMAVEGIVFFSITIFIEIFGGTSLNCVCCSNTANPNSNQRPVDDPDVEAERDRVIFGRADNDLLVFDNLTKMYYPKSGSILAVDGLSLGLAHGECFGLLGLNGAGKSTTFSMLSGICNSTAGEARLNSAVLCSRHRPSVDVLRQVGYCPQTDPLLDELTGREHLEFYAKIRNVHHSKRGEIVESLLSRMGLEHFADKPARTYSGGMKRKLSAALALVSDPQVVLLDEPTTGMDPSSRRFLWNVIRQFREDKRLVVLTSHSMEECEALCSQLGIMASGRLMCLGSTQQLKDKFGEGYTIILRLSEHQQRLMKSSNMDEEGIIEMLLDVISKAFEQHGISREAWLFVSKRYQIIELGMATSRPDLGRLFAALGQLRENNVFCEFSVSQNTLDSVFLKLATGTANRRPSSADTTSL